MDARSVVLVYDLGTTNLKVAAFGADGACVGSAIGTYPTNRPHPLAAEQEPADWWRSAREATMAVAAGSGWSDRRVTAIGVTGQMHGIVLMDEHGDALRPCLTWADERGSCMLPILADRMTAHRVQSITGNPLTAGFSAAKVAWVREHEPATWRNVRSVLLPKDYLRRQMTGTVATDPGDASGTGLFDIARRVWSTDLLEGWGLDPALFPPLLNSNDQAGGLLPDAAKALGLPAGIPVAVGTGDTIAAAVGLGVDGTDPVGPGMLNLGTAGQLLVSLDAPRSDDRLNAFCHVRPDRWCLMAAILDGGGALAWVLSILGLKPGDESRSASELDGLEPGSDGLVFLPQLSGERTPAMDPLASAAFVDVRATHGRSHFLRAAMEGVGYALREGLDVLTELDLRPAYLRLGGGAATTQNWVQIIADVLGVPIEWDRRGDAAARGAAEIAARMIGTTLGLRPVAHNQVFKPRPAAAGRYDEMYERYLEVKARMRIPTRGVID